MPEHDDHETEPNHDLADARDYFLYAALILAALAITAAATGQLDIETLVGPESWFASLLQDAEPGI